jgi:hypothetical protein
MKYTLTLTALTLAAFVGASEAAAVATSESTPFCDQPGQPCWKVKRAVDAFSASLGDAPSTHIARNDDLANDPAFANLTAALFGAEKRSDNEFDKRWCYRLGVNKHDTCWKKRWDAVPATEEGLTKRGADETDLDKRWCYRLGVNKHDTCWKKRDVVEQEADLNKRWCYRLGVNKHDTCWKKRSVAAAVVDETIDQNADDDAEALAKRWCYRLGVNKHDTCWKKRAEEHARCYSENGECALAARDLDSILVAARGVLTSEA